MIAARLGWLPSFPQFDRNPIDLVAEAVAAGASSDAEIIAHVVERLKKGEVRFAIEDPDHPANFPRVLFLWRANLLGASSKGHEYFLKHLLGPTAPCSTPKARCGRRRSPGARRAPEGKLDLLVTLEIRMSTSAMYADVALPAAGWYEMHDINTTDMHPFIHPFNPAIDPPWEARTNWDQFKTIARKFSELAAVHLKEPRTWWPTPLLHDSPGELAQAEVKDWRKGECEPVPGKTMPNLAVVLRDYPNAYRMMTALGPLAAKPGVGSKGIMWTAEEEYAELKEKLGTVAATGVSQGMPALETGRQVAETILILAPETNGATAVKSWESPREAHRTFPQPSECRSQERQVQLRGSDRPAPQDHHHPGLERHRVRAAALLAVCHQHRGEGAVPDAYRPGPFLPGSSLDARLR